MTDSPQSDPHDFTPVPGRARRDGWTPERQQRFIEALAAIGTVTGAARTVGMSAKSAYKLLERAGPDSDFAAAWDRALDCAYHDAFTVALVNSLEGERVPVFYRGLQVGEYRRYNMGLAVAALRAAAARAGGSDRARLGSPTFRRDPRDL